MKNAKPIMLAIICGIMGTAALPPFHVFPLMAVAFSGLFWLLWHAPTGRRAFWLGWAFGLGYFTSGLYWFAYALLVEADKFAWMIPFAVLGLPAALGIFYGGCAWAWWRMQHRLKLSALPSVLMFACFWMLIELLRGHMLTGFPWNLAAYVWAFSLPMMQWAHVIGSYAYTGWTVLLFTLPVCFWLHNKRFPLAMAAIVLLVGIPFGYGLLRLQHNPTEYTAQTLHIVQGNIPQKLKWEPKMQFDSVHIHAELSRKKDLPEDAIIIWSETAFPYLIEAHSPPVDFIAQSLPKKGKLLTGTTRAEWNADRQGIKAFYNSLQVVLPDGGLGTAYDKVKLVPFGEFIPLRGILPVEKITHGMQDFVRGPGAQTLKVKGIPPFQPLICYEAIFPDFTVKGEEKPEWLLNVTNDAWFGTSTGPYQHLQMARFRAVEQGLPLVRAANTGISAVFDAYGRELARLPLNERGAITMKLPMPAE